MRLIKLFDAIRDKNKTARLVIKEGDSGKEYEIGCIEETTMFNGENDICTLWLRPIEGEDDE